MKYSVLLFITIISVIYATSVLRSENTNARKLKTKKIKSKTKEDGSGSWASGYYCGGGIFTSAGSLELVNQGAGTFFAQKLFTPTTATERLGWVFEMKNGPMAQLQKMMVHEGGASKNWYFPFRWLDNKCTYTNPIGFKYLECWITNDAKENFRFKVNLPWKLLGWYIDDDEGNKIKERLNQLSELAHKEILQEKKLLVTDAQAIIANKQFLTAASSSGSQLEVARTNAQNQLNQIGNTINTHNIHLHTIDTEIAELNSRLATSTNTRNALVAELSSSNEKKIQIEKSLATLASDGSTNAKAKAAFSSIVEVNTNNFNAHLAALKASAPQSPAVLNANQAQEAILVKDNEQLFSHSLANISP